MITLLIGAVLNDGVGHRSNQNPSTTRREMKATYKLSSVGYTPIAEGPCVITKLVVAVFRPTADRTQHTRTSHHWLRFGEILRLLLRRNSNCSAVMA